MDGVAAAAAHVPLSRFLLRWLAVWTLSISMTFLLLGMLSDLRVHIPDHLGIAGLLSLAAIVGLSHGLAMRRLVQPPVLWGALTAIGLIVAGSAVVALIFHPLPLLWMTTQAIVDRFAHSLQLAAPPAWVIRVVFVGVVFGGLLGSVQGIALGAGWRGRLLWAGTCAAAAVPPVFWMYAPLEIGPLHDRLEQIATALPLPADWRKLPIFVARAALAALLYALPTGLYMHRLARTDERAAAEALARRFE
jgi:hypothetical protein